MFPSLGPAEMMVVAVLAVLLFGKRLPDVGRSLGKGITEFKKGLRGLEDDLDSATASSSKVVDSYQTPQNSVGTVPKFEPPTTAPTARSSTILSRTLTEGIMTRSFSLSLDPRFPARNPSGALTAQANPKHA